MNIKRGEIYYIDYAPAAFSKKKGGRPAVIVGNEDHANNCDHALVVYLTSNPIGDSSAYVTVRATGRLSTAVCDKIWPVPLSDLGTLYGVCSAQEMEQIDIALASVLDLDSYVGMSSAAAAVEDVPDNDIGDIGEKYNELVDEYNALRDDYDLVGVELTRAKERAAIFESLYKEQLAVAYAPPVYPSEKKGG